MADSSGDSTPNPRFTAQSLDAEDLLKGNTVGLVHFSDFRKRRAEAIEQTTGESSPAGTGANTPDGRDGAAKPVFKKKKKAVKKVGLSFGNEDEDDQQATISATSTPRSATPAVNDASSAPATEAEDSEPTPFVKKKLQPSSSVPFHARALTKSALAKEARLKEQLKAEYMRTQEAVKQTEFAIPFVFYDGSNTPGGVCRMKKGDFIWLFLDRARKLGAEMSSADGTRKDWARIGVDDLMVVKGDLIVPHHYDFHHFILNKTVGYNEKPIFPLSSEPTAATPAHLLTAPPATETAPELPASDLASNLTTASELKQQKATVAATTIPVADLEGYTDDPNLTKVVDRRWYNKNKHIYPASIWEDFDPARDYTKGPRVDGNGNAFFFSR